jgi:chemotaxis protein MotB
VLTKVSTELAKTPHRVEVLGHTDDVPISSRLKNTYPTNWELAGARAASVVRLFEENGLPGDRLSAVSRGEFDPRASNEDAEGRARNRRIEIRLIPTRSDAMPAAAR